MVVDINADITTKDVAKASSDLEAKIEDLEKPADVEVKFGGVTEQINETFTQLGLAMAAAVAIMFSLPFTVIGGLVGLFVTGETLSVSAMMGALMLIGIVVTNAIVLLLIVPVVYEFLMKLSGKSKRRYRLSLDGSG
ncbi:swarming motility protein SwrC [Paenibacillus naphthalenovorans]|uniref:Swarming motility protein SwrC n=1 Tax=Paenibacillus naphthalenovorans TaxID=162209 RepID=A0A0U2MXY5_9BACL|nr:swarming motility protein SwrC [Paenibacillus naphthalenovorans]